MQYSGTGITFNDASTQTTAPSGFGFKNRIINGAMMIDQRNAGASVTVAADNMLTLDRWKSRCEGTILNSYSVQQSSTAPTGFVNSLLVTSLGAASIGSTAFAAQEQRIEGLNMADLGWGSAAASSVTFSFWVRSSLTGTFGGYLQNSAQNRCYVFTYSISSANTWEYKTIVIAGDTTGTWLTTNGIGLRIGWNLGSGSTYAGTAGSWGSTLYYSATGSVNTLATNGATFYITGVQLEKGSTATSFDYRPYGTELALCQRYYQTYQTPPLKGTQRTADSRHVRMAMPLQVTMRATPTSTIYGTLNWYNGSAAGTVSAIVNDYSTNKSIEYDFSNATGTITDYRPTSIYNDTGSNGINLSAEL